MKKKLLSLVAVAALLLTMLPMVFTATALTTADLTEGLTEQVVQNLEVYEPWGANVWYNADLTNTPVSEANRGLYFSDAVSGTPKRSGNIQIKTLANRDISAAEYVKLTLCKNTLPVGSTIVLSFGMWLNDDYVLADGSTVYYDNGGSALLESVIVSPNPSNAWNYGFDRTMTLTVGEAATINVYIPVDSIVYAYGAQGQASSDLLKAVSHISMNFTDLGNGSNNAANEAIADKDAISVKEIAALVPAGSGDGGNDGNDGGDTPSGPQEIDWALTGEKTVLKDFSTMADGNIPVYMAADQWAEGNKLEVVDGEAQLVDHATNLAGYFFFKNIDEKDWSDAEWLSMTVKVKSAPGTAANQEFRPGLFMALGACYDGQAYGIFDTVADSRYWIKDDTAYGMTKGGFDWTFYYENAADGIAVGDTITVYVKVSALAYQWGTSANTMADPSYVEGVWFGLPYDQNGKSMVSITELALYDKGPETLSPEETTPLPDDPEAPGAVLVEDMDKVVIQNFKKFDNFVVSSGWPSNWVNPGLDIWYNNDLCNSLAYDADKGLYIANEGTNKAGESIQIHGTAKWILTKLNVRDFTAAQYLTFTFNKNQLDGEFKAIFSIVVDGARDMVIDPATAIYYDNGSTALQQATLIPSDDAFNRQLVFRTGSADTIKVYIPVNCFRNAYTGTSALAEHMLEVNTINVDFPDLGNKDNADLANADTVSLKEIALYNYNGGDGATTEPAPAESGEKLTAGLHYLLHQDFSGFADMTVENTLYSGDISLSGTSTLNYSADKGLYFGNDGKPLSVAVQKLATSDFSSVKYVAVTFNKNSVTDIFRVKFNLARKPDRAGYSDMGIYYDTGAKVYYDNGEGLRTAVPEKDHMITFSVGSAADVDTVTVYIPTEYLYSNYYPVGGPCPEMRKTTSEDWVNIHSVVMTLGNIGNRNDSTLANEDAISVKNIATYLKTEDEVTLPSDRLLLQDFSNPNMELLYNNNDNPTVAVVENGELSMRGEKGHFDLVVADLMARNITGIEGLAVTIRFKEATSLQLNVTFACETGVYGTGDNTVNVKEWYVDDGFRIRKVHSPNISGGSWVGPILSRPFNSDTVTLYLPLTSINNGEDGVEGIGKTFLKYISISSGWARSIDWIYEDQEEPPYLWALENAFSITKIEAYGQGFTVESADVQAPTELNVLKDFTKVDVENLEYELDNAEAYVRPAVRDGALWFDDLMGKFTPETYAIDMFNTDLSSKDFRNAKYLALNLTSATEHGTTYAMLSLEDAELRPFDYVGEVAYVLAEDGKVYELACDGRVGVDHELYGKNVTLFFPIEDIQLSINYFGDNFAPLDLSQVDCVRSTLYAGSFYSPAALRSITLMGDGTGGSSNGSGGGASGTAPGTGEANTTTLPMALMAISTIVMVTVLKRRKEPADTHINNRI